MQSLNVAQSATKPSTDEELAKLRAKLAVEAIAAFDARPLQKAESSLAFDVALAT